MKLSNKIPFLIKNIILAAIGALASLLFLISTKVKRFFKHLIKKFLSS
jgi:hypothetical protein